jgi:nitroreductase
VTAQEERQQLREICLDQAFIEEAPVVFVCCADLTAYSQASRRARRQEFDASGVSETLSGRFADPAYRERMLLQPDMDRETAMRSATANVYIAIEHMALTATSLGLGSCWVGALGQVDRINELFHLPDHIVPVAVLPVGYPAVVSSPRPRLALDEILLRPIAWPQ